MTWALLGLVAMFGAASITAGVWYHGANKERDRARDAAEKWQEAATKAQGDNRLLEATNKALQGQLDEATRLKVKAEKERDEAYVDAHRNLVEKLRNANLADAASAVARMLAEPWDGSVLPKRPDPNDPRDALIDPATED